MDSFSNNEYSISNFRTAKCNFDNYKEPGNAYDFDDELKAITELKKLFIEHPESTAEHILFISWSASSNIILLTYFDDKAASINSGNLLMKLFYFYTTF